VKGEQAFDQLMKIKSHVTIFKDMDRRQIQAVVDDVEFKKVHVGEVIIPEHYLNNGMYYILSGSCVAKVDGQVIATVVKQQVFGEISALFNTPSTASIIAKEETTLLHFTIDGVLKDEDLEAYMHMYKNIANQLAVKLKRSNSHVVSMNH
jgi:CRP-like cAMP-binding protein